MNAQPMVLRAFVGAMLLVASCEAPSATPEAAHADGFMPAGGAVRVEPRRASIPTHPCTQCHQPDKRAPNPERRRLDELHTRIHLDHGVTSRWCYSCHVADDMNALALPDGRRVDFDSGHELCGACHGEVHADWRSGIHGLTTGYWNGDKTRRSCAHCHDPHAPRSSIAGWSYASMRPRPPPSRKAKP